jgi:hypothetical protein
MVGCLIRGKTQDILTLVSEVRSRSGKTLFSRNMTCRNMDSVVSINRMIENNCNVSKLQTQIRFDADVKCKAYEIRACCCVTL